MGYLGEAPIHGAFYKIDDISGGFDGVTTDFTITVNSGISRLLGRAENLQISINNVVQEPVVSFDVLNYQISFVTPPSNGDTFWGTILGHIYDASDKVKTPLILIANEAISVGDFVILLTNGNVVPSDSISGMTMGMQNVIGISQSGVATGQEVSVHYPGFIDTNQLGLIPGEFYYLSTTGVLSTSQSGVLVGKAISSTSFMCQFTTFSYVSNPNLIINSNGAVNQTESDGTGLNGTFGYDMWEFISDNVSLFTTINSIGWDATDVGDVGILQINEDINNIPDATFLTLSFDVLQFTTGNIYIKGLGLDEHIQLLGKHSFTWSKDTSETNSYDTEELRFILNSVFGRCEFGDIKLEVGSIPTEYEIPKITEEELKCSRYYCRIEDKDVPDDYSIPVGLSTASGSGDIIASIPVPCKMREPIIFSMNNFISASASVPGNSTVLGAETNLPTLFSQTGSVVNLLFTGNFGGHTTVPGITFLKGTIGGIGYIELDARLYS